jgi:adsorption protein B
VILHAIDSFVLWLLAPLAIVFLISGVDDLAIDVAWLYAWLVDRLTISRRDARRQPSAPPRSIAILVPLWKEHEVVGRMLEHNLAAIRYPDYHFFVGAYPNDQATQDAVQAVADRHPNVHLAVCPHDGPTSKADCLNWIYQHIGIYEEQTGEHFDIIVTHDAEDLIHPEELRWINAYAVHHHFIQIPVLALATPLTALTHGVYCDEFAEYHTRDMVVRSWFGCFVPGSGVGTGYRRDALEHLARVSSNRIFEPAALTEDYESGLRLYRLGCRQMFVPLTRLARNSRDFVATREYFPQTWSTALRQRTRWVTGIALQGWEHFGWSGKPGEIYWLWRDRKSLIGSPLGVVANAVFLYGLATSLWTRMTPLHSELTAATLALQIVRLSVRMACVHHIYGPLFALFAPFRALYANALNAAATFQATARYAVAKVRGQPLRWLKTEHSYPSRAALLAHKRRLGEILVSTGYVSVITLRKALASRPQSVRLGEHLVHLGELTEETLYEALSLQQGLPFARLNPEEVSLHVARSLPDRVVRQWRVLPFKVSEGSLHLASPDLPIPALSTNLRAFTALEIRLHLITPSDYEKLTTSLLS